MKVVTTFVSICHFIIHKYMSFHYSALLRGFGCRYFCCLAASCLVPNVFAADISVTQNVTVR